MSQTGFLRKIKTVHSVTYILPYLKNKTNKQTLDHHFCLASRRKRTRT